MEVLIVLALLIALAVLAPRFGHDSRPALHSQEHDFADHNLLPESQNTPSAPLPTAQVQKRHRTLRRHRLANMPVR